MSNILSYLGIGLGSLIFGFGLNYFIIANGLAEGGFTGLALILHYLSGWPVGIILVALNLPLFFLGWYKWGVPFILKTLVGVLSSSLAIEFTGSFALNSHDLLLAALYGGVFSGVGIGLVLRSGATTGGVDIIARLLHDWKGISMGKVYLAFDLVILTLVAFLFGLEKSLYTLVAVFIFSEVVDRIVEGFNDAKAVMIISQSTTAIAQAVIRELDRGATILKGYGAYTGREKNLLYVVVGKHQLIRLKKLVRNLDPYAFVIVNDVHEVLGEGFRKKL